jgi:beta-phosphoglucomutase-like phosphatase (HAD superfamily)
MKIKMVVFDMAGTTVDEDNVVYKTLQEAIVKHSISVTLDEVLSYGAGKEKLQAIMDILDQTNHTASPGIVKEIYNYFGLIKQSRLLTLKVLISSNHNIYIWLH